MTATATDTIQAELDKGQLGTIADVMRLQGKGSMDSLLKVTVAALTASATVDITAAATKAAATINAGALRRGTVNLPAIGRIKSLRVTTSGTANSVGTYAIGDAGSTPISPTAGANVGLATLSDDGKTLVFPTTVTGFVIAYYPAPATNMQATFEQQG